MDLTSEEVKSREIDNIKSDLQTLRDDLGKLLGHVGSYGKGKLGSTREKLGAAVEDMEERAHDRVQGATYAVSEQSQRAMNASRDAVQYRPLTYVGVAFIAGMVFASLFEWKRS
jgi:ElaB/YqjD/DUF883 family membrane-anchored ribosome-binding protein